MDNINVKETYVPTEKTGNIFLLGILLGPLFIALLTTLYVQAIISFPDLFLLLISYILYIILYASFIYVLVRISKCRNTRIVKLFACFLSFFSVYYKAFYFILASQNEHNIFLGDFSLLLNPTHIFQELNVLSQDIYDTVFGIQITGWIIWLFWILQASGILAIGYLTGKYSTFEQVFCENCERWTQLELRIMLEYESEEELQSILESDISHLLTLTPTSDFMDQHILVIIDKCKECDATITLNIDKKVGELTSRYGAIIDAKYQNVSPVYVISYSLYRKFEKINNDLQKLLN